MQHISKGKGRLALYPFSTLIYTNQVQIISRIFENLDSPVSNSLLLSKKHTTASPK